MFTSPKPKDTDLFDLTVLNTPQPQATSTVKRRSVLGSNYIDNHVNDTKGEKFAQPTTYNADKMQKTEDSSLGLLTNISSFLTEVSDVGEIDKLGDNKVDNERELARKLLQRCSDFRGTSTMQETNKENNVNIQNLSSNVSHTLMTDPGLSGFSNQTTQNESTLQASGNKGNTPSVVFEPNEITARSSGLSRSSDNCLSNSTNKNLNVISFNTTTAEFMAQFNNEEFRPASEMASQMLADEASWQQNYSYAIPTAAAAEKEYLDLSCFSGIIGELDLSVESCAGRKMSVDEFFRRKCGNIGELAGSPIERPSLGLSVKSPRKKGGPIPLVDSTIMTEASSITPSVNNDNTERIQSMTKDVEEQSIMSLSSIAKALQDIDNGTPRRLVDQLIMAKKKRRSVNEANTTAETYTVMSSHRNSMPPTPSSNFDKFEKDMGLLNLSTKLSLDSKTTNEALDAKHSIPRMLSFHSNASIRPKDMSRHSYPAPKTEMNSIATSTPSQKSMSFKSDLKSFLDVPQTAARSDAEVELPLRRSSKSRESILKETKSSTDMNEQSLENQRRIKAENISYKTNNDSIVSGSGSFQAESQSIRDVVIGGNTEELCNCIVGVSRESDIELSNNSDRWVICVLNLNQIQGDRKNIQVILPKDVILIKPNAKQCVKIGVKVIKMCKPIIAVVNITVSDMVTRCERIIKHIICFKPEELNMHISNISEEERLEFHDIVENSRASLPVTIENKNSISLPIKLSILQDGPSVFSINNFDELKNLILKPQEVFTANVECKGVLPGRMSDMQQRHLHRHDAKLVIQVKNDADEAILLKEISLTVQVGICKIQVIDTELPVILRNKQSKPLTIINLGNTNATVCASFVQDAESTETVKEFSVEPKDLFLQRSETGSFLITYKSQTNEDSKKHIKIKLTAGGNSYYYSIIGEQNILSEPDNDHYLRCETPQYSSSVSSPTSPHSVTSNRSGISGRNSPLSSISGSTVVGNKLPIRATHAALVWNSVKAGKCDIKEFTIRNTSNNKIKIQAAISDNDKSFRFLRERQTAGTSLVLVLQRTESRTLSVIFNPHQVGASSGKIVFKHYEPKREDNESRPSKAIFLYGYGGYSKVEISEAFKDISGTMWLTLGTLNPSGTLNAKIKLQNTGDLCAYAKIKLTPKAIYPAMYSSWDVNPTEILLNPREVKWVTLEFRPRKEDLPLLQKADVSHVGTITVIHGDEPTRWRIRRLYNKMKESGELNSTENEAFKNAVYPICRAFSGEQLMPELNMIHDSVQNLGDLCRGVRQHEIMLTMEICADETLSLLHDNADDSQMFYSLCSDNSHMYDGNGESFLPSETLRGNDMLAYEISEDSFVVTPSIVVLTPPIITESVITIRSSCKVAQPFETCLSTPDYLSVVPAEGMIPTRKDFQLKIQCKQKIDRNFTAILEIYTENNKQDVQIRVNVKRL